MFVRLKPQHQHYTFRLNTEDSVVVLPSSDTPLPVTLPGGGAGLNAGAVQTLIDQSNNNDRYLHEQNTPSSMWTVNHQLGRYVDVIIYDLTGEQVIAKIQHDTLNFLTITFSEPMAGIAKVS